MLHHFINAQVDSMFSWLNTVDGATLLWGEAIRLGMGEMGHIAYLRILKSRAALNFSSMPSFFENSNVMAQLMFPDIIDYFTEQFIDRPSSTPEYADCSSSFKVIKRW